MRKRAQYRLDLESLRNHSCAVRCFIVFNGETLSIENLAVTRRSCRKTLGRPLKPDESIEECAFFIGGAKWTKAEEAEPMDPRAEKPFQGLTERFDRKLLNP